MIYMFNELSVQELDSKEAVIKTLENFVRGIIRAKEYNVTELRLHERSLDNLYRINLYDNYRIDYWLKDSGVSDDIKDRFREIVTSNPLIKEDEMESVGLYNRSEFFKDLNGVITKVYGLGAAYICDTLSVSLYTHREWEKTEIQISHYYLDSEGEASTEEVLTKNFFNSDTFDYHIGWLNSIQQNSLSASYELWNRRVEFFPNLIFCQEIERQLEKIGVSKMLFQIIERLRTLDNYARNWVEGDFNYEDVNNRTNLRVSPESHITLQKFGSSRKFSVPNRSKEIFSLHIKTGELRFHFYPDNYEHKIYIGYIGTHLRIASED